jgi:hypothetical protein
MMRPMNIARTLLCSLTRSLGAWGCSSLSCRMMRWTSLPPVLLSHIGQSRVQKKALFMLIPLKGTCSSESNPSIHLVSQVMKIFDEFEELDYARAGSMATEDFELVAGPLNGPLGPLPHTVEPLLRKYGLPTNLNKVCGMQRK